MLKIIEKKRREALKLDLITLKFAAFLPPMGISEIEEIKGHLRLTANLLALLLAGIKYPHVKLAHLIALGNLVETVKIQALPIGKITLLTICS